MYIYQYAKKDVSGSPGLVDFAIGLVICVLNFASRASAVFWEIQITVKNCNQCCSLNFLRGYLKDSWASTY